MPGNKNAPKAKHTPQDSELINYYSHREKSAGPPAKRDLSHNSRNNPRAYDNPPKAETSKHAKKGSEEQHGNESGQNSQFANA